MKLVKCSGSVLNSSGMSGTGMKVWLVILQTSSVKQGKFWFNCCSTARVKSSPKSLKMNLCLKQVLDYFSHKWTFPCCYFVAYSGKEIREQRSARGHIMFSERWLPHRPLRNSSIFFSFCQLLKSRPLAETSAITNTWEKSCQEALSCRQRPTRWREPATAEREDGNNLSVCRIRSETKTEAVHKFNP